MSHARFLHYVSLHMESYPKKKTLMRQLTNLKLVALISLVLKMGVYSWIGVFFVLFPRYTYRKCDLKHPGNNG